jgi:nitroimidazol reductase NimA-like FMN-containing flavoprotein (pyridoxamine 5'-phosphate oxidase superfamily)
MEEKEVRMALTTEPVGKTHWQWVVVFASAEEIVRIDRSDNVFATVAEALAAGQVAINAIRARSVAERAAVAPRQAVH